MGWGLLSFHVIVLIPVVLSYHLRTSAIPADFRLTFGSATPMQKLGSRATASMGRKDRADGHRIVGPPLSARKDTTNCNSVYNCPSVRWT